MARIFAVGPLFMALLVATAEGNAFSKAQDHSRPLLATSWTSAKNVRQSLAQVVDATLGKVHLSDVHMEELKDQLRPLFKALPKNSMGRLGHATVRYAMHRFFVQSYGMYVRGLEPNGEHWNSSSPASILEDRVPAFVQNIFEERLHLGFNFDELVLFAATLEHFVHNESVERLKEAYRLNGVEAGITGTVSMADFELVLDVYMATLIARQDLVAFSTGAEAIAQVHALIPTWSDTEAFTREVAADVLREKMLAKPKGQTLTVTFDDAQKVVDSIQARYGKHQNQECRQMAKDLIAKEERGSGRVRLENFYKAGWQFWEKQEYLDGLGALDKSNKHAVYVVIPNYINSVTNCINTSSLYSICCLDGCETILRHLEARIGEPTATPEQLVKLVATTSSPTVDVPRTLSRSLVEHLTQIAEKHGGRVPIHGRLFSMWLHHAYPRECPYPLRSGEKRPMLAEEWMRESGERVAMTEEELEDFEDMQEEVEIVRAKDLADGDMEETLPWDGEEELLFHHHSPSLMHELQVILRAAAAVTAIGTFALGATKGLASLSVDTKSVV